MFNFSKAMLAGLDSTRSRMMGAALTAMVARAENSRRTRHMVGRGRRDMYTYHNVLNNGSRPVPGGGARERARHKAKGEALARMEATNG